MNRELDLPFIEGRGFVFDLPVFKYDVTFV